MRHWLLMNFRNTYSVYVKQCYKMTHHMETPCSFATESRYDHPDATCSSSLIYEAHEQKYSHEVPSAASTPLPPLSLLFFGRGEDTYSKHGQKFSYNSSYTAQKQNFNDFLQLLPVSEPNEGTKCTMLHLPEIVFDSSILH